MSKNINKIIIFVLAFFVGLIPTMAKTMNYQELNEAVEAKGATWYYVIGNYVFTSAYGREDGSRLSIQDFMLSAKKLSTKATGDIKGDPIYDAMTINYVKKEGENWVIQPNKLGTTDLSTLISDTKTMDVKYIDYDIVKEVVDTDALMQAATDKINNATRKAFKATMNGHEIVNEAGTNYYLEGDELNDWLTALKEIVKDSKKVAEVEIKYNNFVCTYSSTDKNKDTNFTKCFNDNKQEIFGKNARPTTRDLIGKTFTVIVRTTDTAVSQNSESEEVYEVSFISKESVNEMVQTELDKITQTFFKPKFNETDGSQIDVEVVNSKTKLNEVSGSNVFVAIGDILNNKTVKSVKLSYGSLSKEFTKEDNGVYAWFITNMQTIVGSFDMNTPLNEMIGKEFDVKVTLVDGYVNTDNTTSKANYKVVFTGDKLEKVTNAEIEVYAKNFEVSGRNDIISAYDSENKQVKYTILDVNQPYYIITKNTNLINAIDAILKDNRVTQVKLSYNGNEAILLSGDTLENIEYKVDTLLKKVSTSITGFNNKEITVEVTIDNNTSYYEDDLTNAEIEWFKLHFEIQKYTVNYDGNGGSVSGKSKETVNGGTVITEDKDPSLAGYKFMGWYEVLADGSLSTEKVTKVTKDLNLKAKWEVIKNSYDTSVNAAVENVKIYDVTLDGQNINVKIDKNITNQSIITYVLSKLNNTGLNTAISAFFNIKGVESVSLKGYSIDKNNYTNPTVIMELANAICEELVPGTDLTSVTHEQLIGKSVTFDIKFAEGYELPEGMSSTYTINFEEKAE